MINFTNNKTTTAAITASKFSIENRTPQEVKIAKGKKLLLSGSGPKGFLYVFVEDDMATFHTISEEDWNNKCTPTTA